jgi:hypothetical protein
MDKFIKEDATKLEWEELQEKQLLRAYEFCRTNLKSPLTLDEFRHVWYSQDTDKQGKQYLANMCMSIFQARKAFAGSSSEKAIEKLHANAGIEVKYQVWVDTSGVLYEKKPKNISVHKVDGIICQKDVTNLNDCILLSMKTSLRERYRQDLDSVGKCKAVIYLTRSTPSFIEIQTIVGYGCILVYPNATNSDSTWSYDEYISRMKKFQETGSYCTS